MKVIYEKEISAIKDWLQRTNAQLSTGALPAFLQTDCWKIQNDLQTISTNIQYEYPFYGHELLEIKNILFSAPQPPYGMMLLNSAAFGELFIIIIISAKPIIVASTAVTVIMTFVFNIIIKEPKNKHIALINVPTL